MLEGINFCSLNTKETEMKQLVLSVAFCFAFVVVGYADRCSDLCNACRKSPRDISTCCQADIACDRKCDVAYGKCGSLNSGGGNGDNHDNNQHFPAFNEREVRREVQGGVDRAIWNYQQNQQHRWGGQFAF
jgi:hypothetical protein